MRAIPVDGQPVNYPDYFYYPVCFNATGHPALTIPMGIDREARRWPCKWWGLCTHEQRLIEFARLVERLHEGFVKPPAP